MVEVGEVQKPSLSDLLERLTLGVSKSLEKRPGVCDVSLTGGEPAERHQIVGWEQRNACMLPDDLKNLYLTTDGLLLTWSVCIEDTKFPVGRMQINPFSRLVKISSSASTLTPVNAPSLADVETFTSSEDEDSEDDDTGAQKKRYSCKPHFDGRSRIFELENCQGYGKVCLVYLNTTPGLPAHKPEIWFLDRSIQWHFLSQDFTSYYRLMLMHLGLPQWHFALTDLGLSAQAKQWFNLYAPVRLKLDEEYDIGSDESSKSPSRGEGNNPTSQKIDFLKIFRGKSMDKGRPKQTPAPQSNAKKKGNFQNFSSAISTKSTGSTRAGRFGKPWT